MRRVLEACDVPIGALAAGFGFPTSVFSGSNIVCRPRFLQNHFFLDSELNLLGNKVHKLCVVFLFRMCFLIYSFLCARIVHITHVRLS